MKMRSTGDPMFDLVAGVYRQALADARLGDLEAAAWLDVCAPDWREIVGRKPHRHQVGAQKSLPTPKSLDHPLPL